MSGYFEKLKKYNYWDGNRFNTGYKREWYLSRIEKLTGTSLVKVLVGQRRAGKSYLLRQVIQLLLDKGISSDNIFYFNKEFFDFNEITLAADLQTLIEEYRSVLHPKGRIYLFFDEMQNVAGWEKIVNSWSQDIAVEAEVYITGSNSTLLSGELATFLSGRYISFQVFPFSFSEFCGFYNLPENRDAMIQYLKSGGLPELFRLDDEEMRMHYVQSLRDTILLRDIVQRYNIKDAWLLENLFSYIAGQTGSLFSVNNIVNYFNSQKIKTNHETVSNYLHYLKQAYLIHEVPRYHIRAKEVLSGIRKYYLNDLAFRNYSRLRFSTGLSFNLENLVFLQILQKGYKIYVGTLKEGEIDFVAESGNSRLYIQVAYLLADEAVIAREFGNLRRIGDHYPKMVISLDDFSLGNIDGIEHVPAWESA
jgi:predicted AAA+ superfamily ATPase